MEDASEDLLQRYGMKQEELYVRVEKELKEIQRSIQLSRVVPIVPSSSKTVELGDEPTQLQKLANATEAQRLDFNEFKKRRNRLQKPRRKKRRRYWSNYELCGTV
jgi:hypothetical protein